MEHPEYRTSTAAVNGIYYQHRKEMKENPKTEMWTEDEDMKFEEMMKAAPAEEKREETFERIGKELGRSLENVKFHFFQKQKCNTPSETSTPKTLSRILGLVENNITVIDLISRISSLSDDDFLILKAQIDAMYMVRAEKK